MSNSALSQPLLDPSAKQSSQSVDVASQLPKIGHETIDHHHEEIFALTSQLDYLILQPNKRCLMDILDYLDQHIEDHFQEEEQVMKDHSYQERAEHILEHNQFRKLSETICEKAQQGESELKLTFMLRQFIDQLIHHIIHTDAKLCKLESHS